VEVLHSQDGAVFIDDNLIDREIEPWKLGTKNWLFVDNKSLAARGGDDEPGAGCQAQRPGPVGMPAQRAGAHSLSYLTPADELLPHRWGRARQNETNVRNRAKTGHSLLSQNPTYR